MIRPPFIEAARASAEYRGAGGGAPCQDVSL
jgi:hypothetical protein